MGFLSRLFGGNEHFENPLKWDMHSHTLFGIDDGSKTLENSVAMARKFVEMGYTKIIATPHIMSDYYPNNRTNITEKKNALVAALKELHIPLEIDFAAEYYMDEWFYEQIKTKGDILTFHGNHVLIETSFMNKPVFMKQLFFDVRTAGYIPVFAHPERYIFLHDNYEEAESLLQSGIKFQINLLSLANYYSPQAKKFALWLIKNGHYSFFGTDAHSLDQLSIAHKVMSEKVFSQIDWTRVENAK